MISAVSDYGILVSEQAIFIHSKLIFSAYKLYEECVGGTEQAKKTVINKLDSKRLHDLDTLCIWPLFPAIWEKKISALFASQPAENSTCIEQDSLCQKI